MSIRTFYKQRKRTIRGVLGTVLLLAGCTNAIPPGIPADVTVVNDGGTLTISWTVPADKDLDYVEVWEHGGWHLSWNRDLVIVGTANDQARMSDEYRKWRRQFETPDGHWHNDLVGWIRRYKDKPDEVYIAENQDESPRLRVVA